MSHAFIPIAPRELAAMEPSALSAWLIERARDAQMMFLSEDYLGLKRLLDTLSEASGDASGEQRDLLEVAEAFVKPLGARYLGGRELAIRAFLHAQGPQGESLLATLLEKGGIAKSALERFPAELQAALRPLLETGVLLSIENRCVLAAGAAAIVRDLLEPPAFRFWAAVERARWATLGRSEQEASQIIAAQTGVLTDEASRFLRAHPLPLGAVRRRVAGGEQLASADVFGQGAPRRQDSAALSIDDDTPPQQPTDVKVISVSKGPRLDS